MTSRGIGSTQSGPVDDRVKSPLMDEHVASEKVAMAERQRVVEVGRRRCIVPRLEEGIAVDEVPRAIDRDNRSSNSCSGGRTIGVPQGNESGWMSDSTPTMPASCSAAADGLINGACSQGDPSSHRNTPHFHRMI